MESLREKAIRRSGENGSTLFIIELDSDEFDRKQVIVKPEYLHYDEFEAFDGRVIAEFYNGKEV